LEIESHCLIPIPNQTKDIDPSERTHDGERARNGDGMANKIERLEEKFSEPTGNEELDDLHTQFLEKFKN